MRPARCFITGRRNISSLHFPACIFDIEQIFSFPCYAYYAYIPVLSHLVQECEHERLTTGVIRVYDIYMYGRMDYVLLVWLGANKKYIGLPP